MPACQDKIKSISKGKNCWNLSPKTLIPNQCHAVPLADLTVVSYDFFEIMSQWRLRF